MPLNEVIRLSISEAAKLFGVNAQTIRRAIKSDEIAYVVVQGRYKISFESLVKWSQRHITIHNKMEKRGIGQYVERWKIRNKLYSPNPQVLQAPPSPEQPSLLSIVSQMEQVSQPQPATPKQAAEPMPVNPMLPL